MGISDVEVQTASEIMDLLHRGNGNRIQAATAANEVSSRSHAVLQVVVENRERTEGTVAKIVLLSLGDVNPCTELREGARLVVPLEANSTGRVVILAEVTDFTLQPALAIVVASLLPRVTLATTPRRAFLSAFVGIRRHASLGLNSKRTPRHAQR